MTLELFITILVISASVTSIAIEITKNLLNKFKFKYKTMPVAVIIAFIVGVIEIIINAVSKGIVITPIIITYSVCMGVANIIGATVGYDTAKTFIYALFSKPEL